MLQEKGCCAVTSSKSIKTPYQAAGGHVEVDIPEGVALVSAFFSVPQNPIIEDREAAVVLIGDHASQLWQRDDLVHYSA